ncbi:hypothetical protein BBJ28_00015785 [Nothophytophthora sp. Chile5]|nr:hypothetical protein BBJ28_00015785 [Nothophytophthora sp. Chile5]
MMQRAVHSQRWLLRQQSSLTAPELGLFEFLVLCFEQIAVAGAAINCFQAAPGANGDDNSSGNAPLLLPAIVHVVPQAVMVITVLSLFIVWGSPLLQWGLRSAQLDCTDTVTFTARRRSLPPIIALLKLFFLVYVTLRLNGSTGLQWKQQTSALCAALILVICEVVDVFGVAHTWFASRKRGVRVLDWREEEGGKVNAKRLILTFFDRWKDCGMVTSFLNQSEMLLLTSEIPSMAWASWTCCQRGDTPERLSYQLHRCVTVLTIVMGMHVVLVDPQIESDVVGATVFLIADVVLTGLRLFEGRHRRRARREAAATQRLTMLSAIGSEESSSCQSSGGDSDSEEDASKSAISEASSEEIRQVLVAPNPRQPKRSDSMFKQCLELKRLGVWKATVVKGVPPKDWVFAFLDCVYSLMVVLNFYETADGAKLQVMPGLLSTTNVSSWEAADEEELMGEVNRISMLVSSGFWTILGLSLAGRWYFLYSSRRRRIPEDSPLPQTPGTSTLQPNYFAVGVEVVKVALLPLSIYAWTYGLVNTNLYRLKQGVNILVAGAIGAIAAARAVDAFGRALHGLGRSAGDPPGVDTSDGSAYVKASTALQVFWDRFNDFLAPLSLDHLVVYTTEASKNFTVVYFLLCVCVLHAVIAYVDQIQIKSGAYRAERLGYLVAVTFLVRNSQKYVERQGKDLYAPVQLVAIEFALQAVAVVSSSKNWCARRQEEKAATKDRTAIRMPMLQSAPAFLCFAMLERAAQSHRWLVQQQSSLAPSELGLFEFLVLCFEQVAVAGAVVNCFQAVNFDGGNAPLLMPAVLDLLPQIVMVIVVVSMFLIWGTRLLHWSLRSAGMDCACDISFVTQRRTLPPVTALLKLFFLLYMTFRLNGSPGLQWKQDTSALCAALILVTCELADVIAIAHTWLTSRVRGEVVVDWDEPEAKTQSVDAKQLLVTFFDRWKDCGMVTSFLNQSEMLLLISEIPSMAWASWSCCQRGDTPERLSYQLHRCVTVLTIVMGMTVVQTDMTLDDDIVGATVFLIADVVLTILKLYEGRHRHQERRRIARALRLTMTPATDGEINNCPSSPSNNECQENATSTCHPNQPLRSDSVLKQCLDLKRLGVWKATVLHDVQPKDWAFAFLDCAYSILVVLNFYETVQASTIQIMPGLLDQNDTTSSSNSDKMADVKQQLIDDVDAQAFALSTGFWSILGLSLAARWYVLYSSSRRGLPIANDRTVNNTTLPNYFAVGVVGLKLALLPVSVYMFAVVFVRDGLYLPKQGVNSLVSGALGAIAAARAVDSLGRALHGLGRSAVGLPGADAVRGSAHEKASTALQVFWDRFNDFLGPLAIVHLVISTTEVSRNFIVVYFLLCVCVLHALIAYVDSVDITGALYLAERLGYLVAVTFLVRNSDKYVERQGRDLFAPVLLVGMEFLLLIASRKKQLDEQKRQFFAIHGDGRSAEDRTNARAMLEALQKKLEDDALREDGFCFKNGGYLDARRVRLSSGMKTRSFETHTRGILAAQILPITVGNEKERMLLLTFGLDCVLNSLLELRCLGRQATIDRFLSVVLARADHEPMVHVFDVHTNAITPSAPPIEAFDVASSYCTGHQQAISCLSFSHNGELLATGSWDSTCMLWEVASTLSGKATTVQLTLLQVFPVHEEGVACLAFTLDDRILVTCGEHVVKLWDVVDASIPQDSAPNQEKPLTVEQQLLEWEQAIPFGFSIERSLNLLAFEESLTSLVANHEWIHVREGDEPFTLLAPAQSEAERNDLVDVTQCLEAIVVAVESKSDTQGDLVEELLLDNQQEETNVTQSPQSEADAPVLTPAMRARLKTQYQSMESFDFEALFSPELSLSAGDDSKATAIRAKTVARRPWDGGGRLLRGFENATAVRSHIPTQELDLVVTVAIDRCIKYWSLERGVTLETVRNAHEVSITCCALTSPTTCGLSVYEMLLATGGSDNLVKVWRRNPPQQAECVYSLAGHYDVISATTFDPSGIFLISTSEDTTAIVWRVRPSSPEQPEVPIVVSIDRFAIGISWTEPLANGARILHYIVRTTQVSSFAGDDSDLRRIPDAKILAKYLAATIEKLQPGVRYTLQIAAVNHIGPSAFSIATEPIETLAFVPSRIDGAVQASDRQATRIALSWTAPCPNGAVILSYTIQCRPENSGFVPLREVTVFAAELQLAAMQPTTPESVTKHSRAAKTGRAGHTTSRKAKSKSNQTEHAEAPVASTTETSSGSDAPASPSPPPHVPTRFLYTVDDLWAGEVYQFVVAASNRCGMGEFSRTSDYIKMDSTVPDQPMQPTIVSVDKRQVDVQWEKPRCNGSEILQYTVRWHQEVEGTPSFKEQTVELLTRTIAGTRYTLQGLEPGGPLRVWVSASNLVDNKLLTSLESPASDVVSTLSDVPDVSAAPQLLEPSSHTLVLALTPPKRNGLPLLGYDVALYSEETQFGVRVRELVREFTLKPANLEIGSAGAVMTSIVRHLRGGTFYSATLSARNALGISGVSDACIPVQTRPPTVPETVATAPLISEVTPTSATVAWSLPSHDGGAPLRGFHIEYSVRSALDHQLDRMESGGDVVVCRGLELLASFLKPQRVYRFRVAPENAVGRATPSDWSVECVTPSLVTFTVTRYFAHRPQEEHDAARVLQRRYRAWRRALAARAQFTAALIDMLRHWHML